ncbi:MAG: hypothetical protein K2J48_04525 [Muribaculaceae bacterium]|nr:hypothetical protein [Muribaculaceae bacterium]
MKIKASIKNRTIRTRISSLAVMVLAVLFNSLPLFADSLLPPVYDIEAARDLCKESPLDNVEGIWYFPDDNVTVLIRRIPESGNPALPAYQIMAIESTDCRIIPGSVIGTMKSSAESTKYVISFNHENKKGGLGKSKECMATLSKEHDSMILTRDKSKFNLRINLNPNSLLPTLWRSLVRFGISVGTGNDPKRPAPGMIKLYPSYDGNGSSRL